MTSSMKDLLGDTPYPAPQSAFRGSTYDAERDFDRLSGQMRRVAEAMKDGSWKTLAEIAQEADAPEASVSARIRDLRRLEWGAHTVEREHVSNGLHQYRLRRVA
jgi:hypothetical protein